MKCVNCPYIQEQLKDRIKTALRYDGFIPDYKSAEYEDVDGDYDEFEDDKEEKKNKDTDTDLVA